MVGLAEHVQEEWGSTARGGFVRCFPPGQGPLQRLWPDKASGGWQQGGEVCRGCCRNKRRDVLGSGESSKAG
eukprot:5622492-Lingulodinium_polyedra.AAC.1